MDANGNITALSDKTGSGSWTWDENNQPTVESRTQNGTTKTARYSYFANGQQSAITTFSGQTVSFGYDAALRLSSQTDPNDGGRAITYGYDTRSRRDSITFGSGVSQRMTFDTAGRIDLLTLQKSDGTKLQSFDYAYGSTSDGSFWNGYVRSVTELDGSKVSYSYDDLNRLSGATRTGTYPFSQSYGYDLNNNRTSITKDGTTTSATYDAANQMTSLGGTGYSYDRNGNLTAFGSNSLNYDESNKWVSGTVNGNDVTFGYDGFGRRSSRTVGTGRIDYWYDVTGLTLQTGATNATFLRDQSGSVRSITSGGATHNYGKDRLGSVTAMVATDGTVARTYSYDPWGETIGITGTAYNPFLFTGTYKDGATGLYQMGARYYQPSSGRFTQQDPLPDSILSFNRYAYAGCNPSNNVDPSGLSWTDVADTCIPILLNTLPGLSDVISAANKIGTLYAAVVGIAGSSLYVKNIGDAAWLVGGIILDIAKAAADLSGSSLPIVGWIRTAKIAYDVVSVALDAPGCVNALSSVLP